MPPPPPPDPAVAGLDDVAREASARVGQTISRVAPRDSALGWKSASVHPLQVLETEYQGIVHDAVRGIVNPDARKTLESETMARFFFFDSGTPRLLGVAPGQGFEGEALPLPDDKLREANVQIKTAIALLDPPPQQPVDGPALRDACSAADQALVALLRDFLALPGSQNWGVPKIADAIRLLKGLPDEIRNTHRIDEFKQIVKRLQAALDNLKAAQKGLATVQMFYVIEGFYLFRLLVRYRVESERLLSPETVAKCSGELTDLVANGHVWLTEWLSQTIVDLAARILAADPSGNTLFFLKGGRAIRYLEGHPEKGKNDWDTQIVINPNLPAEQFYELFRRIANTVLIALEDYKAQFYMLLHRHAAQFAQEVGAAQPMDIDDDDLPDEFVSDPMDLDEDEDAMDVEDPNWNVPGATYRANCKAELIDVGLPRYDSIEAHEQWEQLNGQLRVAPDGMPYPSYLYYIGESVSMIREVFAGLSPSQRKAPSRIERLYGILGLGGVVEVIQDVEAAIPPALLPNSLALVGQIGDPPTRYSLIFQLSLFATGYGLAKDPGLAAQFDAAFAANLPNAHQLAPYSQALAEAMAQAAQNPDWPAGANQLADAIGYCQWVSQQMEAHLAQRGAFMAAPQQAAPIDDFLRTLFDEGIFKPTEELEVQLAIHGSFAARLQSEYSESARTPDLDPVAYVGLGLYSPRDDASPQTMLELVSPLVDGWLQSNPGTFTAVADPQANAIRLYWSQPATIGTMTYAPLAIEIVALPPPKRPLLSYIWGLATLGLRDLVIEYRQDAAAIEEFGRRRRLKESAAALTEIMTRAANPEPPNPALVALQHGTGHHLMISSAARAIGPDADYPASYYLPDFMAYQVTITPNQAAARNALTLGATQLDRVVDLLVLNQDHGGIGRFAQWNEAEIRSALVEPLVRSGVQANLIILDFCVSASLLPVFAPLCAPGGLIMSALYSINIVIADTDFWTAVQPALQQRNLAGILNAMSARARFISAQLTGKSHLQNVRSLATPETDIARHLALYPNDRDAISITRYLPLIAGALNDPTLPLATSYAELSQIRGVANLGYAEQAILANLPAQVGQFTAGVRTGLVNMFGNRINQILTQPQYGIQINPPNLPVFGPNSLYQLVAFHYDDQILSLAAGLTRCPNPFTRFDSANRSLTLDAALAANPLTQQVSNLISVVESHAPQDVNLILTSLIDNGTVALLNPVNNYLQ
jgi:hypothetical protein